MMHRTILLVTLGSPTLVLAAEAGNQNPILPQLTTMAVTLLVFIAALLLLSKFAWKPILTGLRAREDKIRSDIEAAEKARLSAEARLVEYEKQLATAEDKVRAMFAQATTDAAASAERIKQQAEADAQDLKARAARDMEAAKAQAIDDIRAQAAELSTSIASQILRRNLNEQDQSELVRRSLDQLKNVN